MKIRKKQAVGLCAAIELECLRVEIEYLFDTYCAFTEADNLTNWVKYFLSIENLYFAFFIFDTVYNLNIPILSKRYKHILANHMSTMSNIVLRYLFQGFQINNVYNFTKWVVNNKPFTIRSKIKLAFEVQEVKTKFFN